jgi:hypothetical protein
VSKVVLGILTGILIFIAAGLLATYWVAKMRREMEQKRPQVAVTVGRGATRRNTLNQARSGPILADCRRLEPINDRLARNRIELR